MQARTISCSSILPCDAGILQWNLLAKGYRGNQVSFNFENLRRITVLWEIFLQNQTSFFYFLRITVSLLLNILLKVFPTNANWRWPLPPVVIVWKFWDYLDSHGMNKTLVNDCSVKVVETAFDSHNFGYMNEVKIWRASSNSEAFIVWLSGSDKGLLVAETFHATQEIHWQALFTEQTIAPNLNVMVETLSPHVQASWDFFAEVSKLIVF